MKKILAVLAVFCSLSAYSQREYTYENKGINLFLEGEGAGNREFGIGGVAVTVGYQFNPHMFFGVGIATQYGCDRYFNSAVHEDWGWYDESSKTYHSDYYLDNQGYYHEYQSSYYEECWDDGFCDMYMDFFANFRYNFLAKSRYTPYLDLRSGIGFNTIANNSLGFDDVIAGCRFGCGEGDFAITAGAGYSFRRLDYKTLDNQQHMFTLRLGVEF